jgi:hypothetical protein
VNQLLAHTASTIKHADMEGTVNEYLSDSEDSNFDSHDESVVNILLLQKWLPTLTVNMETILIKVETHARRHAKLCGAKKSVLQYLWIIICNQQCLQICQSSGHFSHFTGEINCCEHCHGKTYQIK